MGKQKWREERNAKLTGKQATAQQQKRVYPQDDDFDDLTGSFSLQPFSTEALAAAIKDYPIEEQIAILDDTIATMKKALYGGG